MVGVISAKMHGQPPPVLAAHAQDCLVGLSRSAAGRHRTWLSSGSGPGVFQPIPDAPRYV